MTATRGRCTSATALQYLLSGLTIGSIYAIVAHRLQHHLQLHGHHQLRPGRVRDARRHDRHHAAAPAAPAARHRRLGARDGRRRGGRCTSCSSAWLKNPAVLRMIIITIGLSILMREAALHLWDEKVRALPFFSGNETTSVALLGARHSPQVFWVMGVSALMVAALGLFFRFTLHGRAMRACAAKPDRRAPVRHPRRDHGDPLLHPGRGHGGPGRLPWSPRSPRPTTTWARRSPSRASPRAVLGGLGNSAAAVAAGLVLGVLEAFSVSLLPPPTRTWSPSRPARDPLPAARRASSAAGCAAGAVREQPRDDHPPRLRPFAPSRSSPRSSSACSSRSPPLGPAQYLTQLTMAAYYALVALGLCLLMGYAGQISLGHAGFFAIGGYASAVVSTTPTCCRSPHRRSSPPPPPRDSPRGRSTSTARTCCASRRGSAPWSGSRPRRLPLSSSACPSLRLRGHYLAMATLGFGIIVHRIVIGTPALGAGGRHPRGPRRCGSLPGLAVTGRKALRVQNYYIAWALVVARPRLHPEPRALAGRRALRAIHGDEDAAAALGVDTGRAQARRLRLRPPLYAALGRIPPRPLQRQHRPGRSRAS